MSIVVKQLSYIHSDRVSLFYNIEFSVSAGQKVSLVGNNGSGKSTLLRILASEIEPDSGEVLIDNNLLYYVPQHFGQYEDLSIAEALKIDAKINALNAIVNGDASQSNFDILNDDWDIEEKAINALQKWGLGDISLSNEIRNLSGGEKTKVFLAGIDIHAPSIILLDEPSNHLDRDSRDYLYQLIKGSRATIIVVSHDRKLLNLVDTTYELTSNTINEYGGNYDFYKEQRSEKLEALIARQNEKEKELRKAKQIAREASERKSKEDARGEKRQLKKGVARIMMNTLKDKAEQSSSKLKDVHAERIDSITADLQQIKNNMPDMNNLRMNFDYSNLHFGKVLVFATGLNYSYTDKCLWKEPLNFELRSGERVEISGRNGVGKTTLVNLMLGSLLPSEGEIYKSDFTHLYLDQEYSIIDNSLTVYEQIEQSNMRGYFEHELKMLLHQFLFSSDTWNKECYKLSGGEKMKLVFCSLLVGNSTPDVIILDEPTNNLDIQSLEVITETIKGYKGSIIVISHDKQFIEDIEIEKQINLC